MMSAAAPMTAQSGERAASHTPKGDMQAPPRPAATPSFGRQVLFRIWETAPEIDVGMMVNSEVAVVMPGSMSAWGNGTGGAGISFGSAPAALRSG